MKRSRTSLVKELRAAKKRRLDLHRKITMIEGALARDEQKSAQRLSSFWVATLMENPRIGLRAFRLYKQPTSAGDGHITVWTISLWFHNAVAAVNRHVHEHPGGRYTSADLGDLDMARSLALEHRDAARYWAELCAKLPSPLFAVECVGYAILYHSLWVGTT